MVAYYYIIIFCIHNKYRVEKKIISIAHVVRVIYLGKDSFLKCYLTNVWKERKIYFFANKCEILPTILIISLIF